DWGNAWKKHFTRLVISPQLIISPPWEAQPGDIVIEPGMAFGSGDHPTTRACLDSIVRHARPGQRCLDVGCGSGILALAAARLGMVAAGIDIDEDAIRVAKENAEQNGLNATFSTTPLALVDGMADLVVANVYAEVLVDLAPDLARRCRRRIALAGILATKADGVIAAFPGFTVSRRQQDGEWVSLELERP
ncbi:MAG: 50S ribosomal protein L11 methyltransferase, partial [Myxococcota bacterium]